MVSTMVIGPGRVNLQLARGMGAGVAGLRGMHAALEPQRPSHRRHHRLVAVVADAHLDTPAEIDAIDVLEKAVHEMLARLLAIGDDVDAGVLLQLDRKQRGIELAGFKLGAGEAPLRPQRLRLGEPDRLRQTAGNGGGAA